MHPMMSLPWKPQLYHVKFWSKSDQQFPRYSHFCILPPLSLVSQSNGYQHCIWAAPETWPHNWHHNSSSPSLPRPQQMPLPVHWQLAQHPSACQSIPVNSQDAYHSFSIFCNTLENWLLLNCILPDSEDHLRYVFAALGTKSLEMHAQWMPTGSKEEQKATKVKASAFLDQIQQGMTHDVNTHVHLGELEEIVARLGEDHQDLITHIKTLMDHCEMINDEHHEHELHCHIVCTYCHKGKLLGKLMAKPFKTPSNELADITVNHFAIQHAREQVSHLSKPVDTICQDKRQMVHTSHSSNGHTPSAPSKDCPTLHPTAPSWQSKLSSMWFPLFQMQQNGTLGTKMPWWQATPIKECTSTWVTAEEVQMPT